MSRFFFDVFDDGDSFDTDGVEFESRETMENAAMRAAGTMISERAGLSHGRPWTMVIRDEHRVIIRTFVFDVI